MEDLKEILNRMVTAMENRHEAVIRLIEKTRVFDELSDYAQIIGRGAKIAGKPIRLNNEDKEVFSALHMLNDLWITDTGLFVKLTVAKHCESYIIAENIVPVTSIEVMTYYKKDKEFFVENFITIAKDYASKCESDLESAHSLSKILRGINSIIGPTSPST